MTAKKSSLDDSKPEVLIKSAKQLLSIIQYLMRELDRIFGREENSQLNEKQQEGSNDNDDDTTTTATATTTIYNHRGQFMSPPASEPKNLDRLKNLLTIEEQQLQSLLEAPHKIKKQHVKSTNVYVYQGMVDIMREEVTHHGRESVVAVLETVKWVANIGAITGKLAPPPERFHSKQHRSQSQSLTVDLVLRHGAVWLKVKARNKKAVQENFLGMTDGSEKCITQVAEEMQEAASLWSVNYKPRQCAIFFTKGVTEDVAEALKEMGVVVLVKKTDTHDLDELGFFDDEPRLLSRPNEPDVVNLDITTLIVLVAEASRDTVDLKKLLDYISGKKRIVCTHSALKHFSSLVELGANEVEKQRAADMILDVFNGVTTKQKDVSIPMEIIPDEPDEIVSKNLKGSKIKPYHKSVFGTAHKFKFVTSTSNAWLVSCAESRDIHLSVHLHRSFTLALFDRNDCRKRRMQLEAKTKREMEK